MADANLLEILDKESKLDNMIVYGNVRCAIKKPNFLSSSVGLTDGFFALVDVLALRCNGEDYFSKYTNYQDNRHIYFSKGSLVVVLNDKEFIGKNVRIYGRTLKGCTIKKQRTNSNRDGIVAFAWTKNNGSWCIIPNKVLPFGETDARGTVLEDYIVSLVNGVGFTYPYSINAIMEYSGVLDAEPLDVDKVKGALEYSDEPIDLSSIPLNLTYRLEASDESVYTDIVGEAVVDLRQKARSYSLDIVSDIKRRLSEENSKDFKGVSVDIVAKRIISSFVQGIASKYNVALGKGSKVKGKEFVEDLLDSMSSARFRDPDNEDNGRTNTLELYKDIEDLKKRVALDPFVMELGVSTIPVMRDCYKYASMIIGEVTGIGVEGMVASHNSSGTYNDLGTGEWFWCLIRNPYLCGLLGGSLNIVDCDRIFCSFSEGFDKEECLKYRNMLLMLDSIKNASSRSTLISKRELVNSVDSYPALGKRYIEACGFPFSRDCLVAVSLMKSELRAFNKTAFYVSSGAKRVLEDLNNIGLIEEVNDGIILSRDLHKEYVIYSTLIEKGRTPTGITDEDIKDTVEKFEALKGFSLEKLQKDGINLIKYEAGVLSGCAGSGKTTTSDCMVAGIEAYLPSHELRFGAPTGKAARRLAEVVGGNVKTIHSMFGLGLDSEPYITKRDKFIRKNDEGVSYAYILDEMAMSNSNLMYEIVNHLNSGDLIYFLGDIKQLSPIGKGSPFRALMHFLPCVELGVSKRAAANGKINYNCGLINFVSDEKVVELQEGNDFEIKPCKDVDIQKETVDMFSRYLGEFAEDDIQVVTGYQTDKYPWSTAQLNPLLQNLLRKDKELLYVYNEQKFMKNDRVIHTKRNAYDMPRYRLLDTGSFEEVVSFGIVNGELGKIVGYIQSTECRILPWQDEEYSDEDWSNLDKDLKSLILKRRNTSVEIRNESTLKEENVYFVIVQVYDVDLKEDVVVLYHANFRENVSNEFYSKTFTGGDLNYLDLAYALTTHKMQGSQSPAIIIPLGSSSSPQFMNRNMLNTMITRASQKVGLVGSVRGKNSALTNGRRLTNIEEGEDVLSILAE